MISSESGRAAYVTEALHVRASATQPVRQVESTAEPQWTASFTWLLPRSLIGT